METVQFSKHKQDFYNVMGVDNEGKMLRENVLTVFYFVFIINKVWYIWLNSKLLE